MIFLLAQLIGFFGLACHVICFQQSKRGGVLLFTMLGCVFWATHFLLLGFYTAALINLLVAVRSFVFYEVKSHRSDTLLYVFTSLFVVSTLMTWQGPISLLPLAAVIISTYAAWQLSAQKIRWITLPTPVIWFVHNAIAGSIPAMISDASIFTSIVVGLRRYRQKPRAVKTVQDAA